MPRRPPTGVLTARVPLQMLEDTATLARCRGVDRQDIIIAALALELATAPELPQNQPPAPARAANASPAGAPTQLRGSP